MGIVIKKIEYYVPKKKLTNYEINSINNNWTPEKIEEKIGIKNRFVVQKNETALDLAYQACEKLFNSGVEKSSIDSLILCTQSPEYFLPTTACILQDRLGLNKNSYCLDFNLGCSGYIYGLAMAKGLIEIGVAKNLLLVTSETYTKYISDEDASNRSLFGDAATVTLISKDRNNKIKDFVFGTDGSGFKNLIVEQGATKNLNSTHPSIFFMNGPEIFSFTNSNIPKLINETLIKNNFEFDKIDYFVFHQANKYMLEHLRKKIGIEKDKFLIDMEDFGNTVSNTIPIVLANKFFKKSISKQNKYVMLVGFGVGYSWGATIIKI